VLLSAVLLSAVLLSAVLLSAVLLSAVLLSAVLLSVVLVSVLPVVFVLPWPLPFLAAGSIESRSAAVGAWSVAQPAKAKARARKKATKAGRFKGMGFSLSTVRVCVVRRGVMILIVLVQAPKE
jgi:hypothetical protein